jgi:hypothetical protein
VHEQKKDDGMKKRGRETIGKVRKEWRMKIETMAGSDGMTK